MMLGMTWEPMQQTMWCDDLTFTHEGPICTHPSHDLAHLLVRAASDLPWVPSGSDSVVRLAEYNATILEHFLDAAFNHAVAPLEIAREYGTWFVEKHFCPFPISAEEAYRRFREGIDWDAINRLSPYFFALKHQERESGLTGKTFTLLFTSDDSPSKDKSTDGAEVRL